MFFKIRIRGTVGGFPSAVARDGAFPTTKKPADLRVGHQIPFSFCCCASASHAGRPER
ncbi:hypothetical protein CHCC15087_3795 [Bacillus licheniformis]|nr:hypothetical protein CHCC15087_3795 [Bacillus licheniformis]